MNYRYVGLLTGSPTTPGGPFIPEFPLGPCSKEIKRERERERERERKREKERESKSQREAVKNYD